MAIVATHSADCRAPLRRSTPRLSPASLRASAPIRTWPTGVTSCPYTLPAPFRNRSAQRAWMICLGGAQRRIEGRQKLRRALHRVGGAGETRSHRIAFEGKPRSGGNVGQLFEKSGCWKQPIALAESTVPRGKPENLGIRMGGEIPRHAGIDQHGARVLNVRSSPGVSLRRTLISAQCHRARPPRPAQHSGPRPAGCHRWPPP